MITVKIDVTLINKEKLFTGKPKNGRTPKYLDLVLFENRHGEDQYGNHYVVCQAISKEERQAGKKGAILGNGKIIQTSRPKPEPEINQMRDQAQSPVEGDDDVPF